LKKQTKQKWSTHILYMLFLIALIAFASIALIQSHSSRQKKPRPDIETPPYSETELKRFWDENMGSTLRSLIGGSYRIAEIQQRYNDSISRVDRKYGRIGFNMSTTYIQASKNIFAGCDMMSDGTPSLILVMPAIADAYKRLAQSGDTRWSERFENLVIVAVLHELDHIAYEDVLKNHSQTIDFEELIDHERRAWARTCEYTMGPLLEKYGLAMSPSDMVYYTKWVDAGRDVDSPLWVGFIRSAYGVVKNR
jgi:hypothetical protein